MDIKDLLVIIRGAGEMASGLAWRLHMAHIRLLMTEQEGPLAVRRKVSFCEAVHDGAAEVEGVTARLIGDADQMDATQQRGEIPVLVDPGLGCIPKIKPDVLVEATLSKKNTGIHPDLAPLVIALGPGFTAGQDAHMVIETNRGHHLGRIISEGNAAPNTGIPGNIAGYTADRVLRAPESGIFETEKKLGDMVKAGETVASAGGQPVEAQIDGILRGLIRPGFRVSKGLKVGDIDPRGDSSYLDTISEKARAIGGSVLEGILRVYNL